MHATHSKHYFPIDDFRTQDILDHLTDEEVEEQYFNDDDVEDEENNIKNKTAIEELDKMTTVFMGSFLSLSEGVKRSAQDTKIDPQKKLVVADNNYRRHPHLYAKEVGFFDDSNFNESVNFKYVILSIVSVFLRVFVGIENFYSKPNSLNTKEMELIWIMNEELWDNQLKKLYVAKFHEKIAQIFVASSELIAFKVSYSSELLKERIFLYAQIGLGIIAKYLNKRNYMLLAIASSALTSIGMLVHYGKVSITDSKKAADLRHLVEATLLDASKFRAITKRN